MTRKPPNVTPRPFGKATAGSMRRLAKSANESDPTRCSSSCPTMDSRRSIASSISTDGCRTTAGVSAQVKMPAQWEGEKDGQSVTTHARNNMRRWSGNHCCDALQVPGVLFINRAITNDKPALTDLAPTILQEFRIAKPSQMIG